ncbi:MAG TPA: DNA alkylation repair protein [Flavobacteriales bacterium]|nr:DNA alkylation repair protein [Flavobacteriales bacterium]
MAEPLKYLYNKKFFESLTCSLEKAHKDFDRKTFLKKIHSNEWDEYELKQRMDHVAKVLHMFLPADFKKAVPVILKTIAELKRSGVRPGFEHIFFAHYIELYGQDDLDTSLNAIERITQFISCEFAIRPFIIKYPKRAMAQLLAWSKHKNEHVRRLSSEGCRPRLPWAMALPAFKKDPSLILPILENLKHDPSLFVRKSVANNLNDISRDHPALVIALAKKWKGSSNEADWIIKHGSRTLLKKADASSLGLFGFSNKVKPTVKNFKLDKSQLRIGDTLSFGFLLTHGEKQAVKLRVEFGIYYMKANGKQNRKLFKVTENTYAPKKEHVFKRNHSFADLTTRKHYAGKHKLAIVVNGQELASTEFMLK